MRQVAFLLMMILGAAVVSGCTSTTPPAALESVANAAPEPVEADLADPDPASTDTAVFDPSDPAATTDGQADPLLQANAASALQPGSTASDNTALQAATLPTLARLQVSPVVGAPAGAAQPMARRIASRSRERGIALLPPGSSGATHNIKGYFSAITESGKTTVIYVWDVFDASGARLHRIQGQESAPGSGPDGWSSVSSRMMETIGTRTVDDFASWLEGRRQG